MGGGGSWKPSWVQKGVAVETVWEALDYTVSQQYLSSAAALDKTCSVIVLIHTRGRQRGLYYLFDPKMFRLFIWASAICAVLCTVLYL